MAKNMQFEIADSAARDRRDFGFSPPLTRFDLTSARCDNLANHPHRGWAPSLNGASFVTLE
jgi:hypothetical protein